MVVRLVEGLEVPEREDPGAAPAPAMMEEVEVVLEVIPVEAGVEGCQDGITAFIVTPVAA